MLRSTMARLPAWTLAAVLVGCATTPPPADTADSADTGDTGVPVELECGEAAARLGYPACEHRVPDDPTFEALTIASSSLDQLRIGKYLVPAVDDARLPPVFLYVGAFPLHYDFLTQAFPDLFAGLTTLQYVDLILYPDTREFYAGTYGLYLTDDSFAYGFTVWDDPSDPTSTVTEEDVEKAWLQLRDRFEIGELYWVPNSSNQIEASASWTNTAFPILGREDVDYEVYNAGTAFGTMRLYPLDDLDAATENSDYGYQDILALDEAPEDLERVVSAIITGTRQGDLSHLNVRSSARGTPNCYVKDPLDALAPWEGKLVAFTCGETEWSVREATEAEAEAYWESIRPDPIDVCEPQTDERTLAGLLELDTSTSEARQRNFCTYGCKGSNLATLYQRLDPAYQGQGFLIPFSYYQQFMNESTWTVDLGSGPAEYTFQETIEAWHADPTFLTDPVVRRADLVALQTAMKSTPLNPDVEAAISDRIVEVFGSEFAPVRFRSSSNAEDSLYFSGAGLYDSVSACVADGRDTDQIGPSHCDADEDDEETVTMGLTAEWAELWGVGPWEERAWYGMDQTKVAMGILVFSHYIGEQANAVAFSGNPGSMEDDRYLVNAQEGELEVVSSKPGEYPETELLTVTDGEVSAIDRVSSGSEVPEVLTDAELEELGSTFYDITAAFPLDYDVPEGHDVVWDTEWKIDADGQWRVKQIRPFMR